MIFKSCSKNFYWISSFEQSTWIKKKLMIDKIVRNNVICWISTTHWKIAIAKIILNVLFRQTITCLIFDFSIFNDFTFRFYIKITKCIKIKIMKRISINDKIDMHFFINKFTIFNINNKRTFFNRSSNLFLIRQTIKKINQGCLLRRNENNWSLFLSIRNKTSQTFLQNDHRFDRIVRTNDRHKLITWMKTNIKKWILRRSFYENFFCLNEFCDVTY